MLSNIAENLSASSGKTVLLVLTLAAAAFLGLKVIQAKRQYGTTRFLSPVVKWGAGLTAAILVLQGLGLSRPYAPPATGEIAIVLGNTQNTPNPQLGSDVASLIEATMLLHSGDTAEDLADSLVFVSASGNPQVIPLETDELKLVGISINKTRAERDARKNMKLIQSQLNDLPPSDNGANYFEAILLAKQNISDGTNIVVVGSGLSDSGDFDFAHNYLLRDEKARTAATTEVVKAYGRSYLAGHRVTFAGLGDTTKPQEPLTPKQKDIVRDFYKGAVTALGADVAMDTKSLTADPVETKFTVSTTDTGCGNVGLRFGEESVQFVSNEATFLKPTQAKKALLQVVKIYQAAPTAVQLIKIDGYIANVASSDPTILSKARASAVRDELVAQGVPADKIQVQGKGFGPYNVPEKDRMVKIAISRKAAQGC